MHYIEYNESSRIGHGPLCTSVNQYGIRTELTQFRFDNDALAYFEITLTTDPRYKAMYSRCQSA